MIVGRYNVWHQKRIIKHGDVFIYSYLHPHVKFG